MASGIWGCVHDGYAAIELLEISQNPIGDEGVRDLVDKIMGLVRQLIILNVGLGVGERWLSHGR